MRAHGLSWATPLSAVVIALSELTRVPSEAHRGDPGRLLAAFAQLARSAFWQFAGPAAVLLALVGLSLLDGPERWRRRSTLVGMVVLGVAASLVLRHVVVQDQAFEDNGWTNAGFVVLALVLAAIFVWLARPASRASVAAGLAIAVASLSLARLHYVVYVGLYPTLHSCALCVAFVGLAIGLALAASGSARTAARPALAVAIIVPFLVVALLDLPAAAWARPYVVAYTELGRAAGVARALELESKELAPTTLPLPRTDPILAPDPDAERRFAAHSGLPDLPSSFDLRDRDVLLVLSDATRFDRTSLARPDGPTPELASLARQGAYVFDRAYAPSNGTFPSVASMLAMTPVSFTELDIRPRFWRGTLRPERTTAAEAMHAAGRATFWVGHDHRGCFTDHQRGLEQGFDERVLVPDADDADARIAQAAIDAIRRRAGRRFFGIVFFGSPHDDYRVHYAERPADTDVDRYDQELAYVDEQLGVLVRALSADGRLAQTVIVFAGDHGEAFGEHGNYFHLSSMHAEQIHVPLLVWTGGGGARIHDVVSTSYVLPWLLARGAEPERAAAQNVLREDVGPMMRALDGAVLSEMIGQRDQRAALMWNEHTVVYDVLADLVRIYDAEADPTQEHDLREEAPELLGRFVPLVRGYRRARFGGRRFRFIGASP